MKPPYNLKYEVSQYLRLKTSHGIPVTFATKIIWKFNTIPSSRAKYIRSMETQKV